MESPKNYLSLAGDVVLAEWGLYPEAEGWTEPSPSPCRPHPHAVPILQRGRLFVVIESVVAASVYLDPAVKSAVVTITACCFLVLRNPPAALITPNSIPFANSLSARWWGSAGPLPQRGAAPGKETTAAEVCMEVKQNRMQTTPRSETHVGVDALGQPMGGAS